jgi:diaminohydroxyphosphoribosylaminopyrimidine deaminase/5-amino-6-(5-phosphoribosylamino)uracil reductase
VLVRDGDMVGDGATQPPGQAHAEVVAIRAAGENARGATLYVTLEPCAHIGRTAPCVDAILAAGIADVHVAMIDPSPWVDGRGQAALEAAGVRVRVGSHEDEARRLNEAYLTWVLRGRPLVTAMYALGIDGQPRPLTDAALGEKALAEIERLRARADMTVQSADALLIDDPSLSRLASSGVTSLIVESTPAELGSLLAGGLVDRIMVFVTPTLSADRAAAVAVAGGRPDVAALPVRDGSAPALQLRSVAQERLGESIVITGYVPCAATPLADAAPTDT